MINPIQMNRINPSAFSSLTGDMMGLPETGEFDFMNYLLGLQVNPLENGLEVDGNQINIDNNSGKSTESDKVLLEVFGKKNKSEEAIVEGQVALANYQPTSALPKLEVQSKEVDVANAFDGPRKETKAITAKTTSITEDQNQLEDPLAKMTFDASIQDKDGKSVLQNQFGQFRVNAKGTKDVKGHEEVAFEKAAPEVQIKAEESVSRIERPRKKDSDLLDAVIDDKSMRGSDHSIDQKPAIHDHKVQNSHAPELFHKVESMVLKGGGKMTLTLTPPELGQVEIEVTTKGRNVEVSVKSDNDFAKAAIESQVSDLQQSLQDQDLNLSKIEVHVSREMEPSFLENQYAGFSRQGNFYQSSQGHSQESYYRGSWETTNDENSIRPVSVMQNSKIGNGRLDIRI